MLLLSRNDIDKVFTMRDSIEGVKEAFRLFSEGKSEVPLRGQIPAPKYEGTFLSMPAYVEELDIASLKLVNIFPRNIDMGIPSAPATVVLMDGKTGEFTSIMDGTYVTQLRTGAASGAAFDLLAKKDCKKGALIGTGGQAAKQLEAMIEVRNLDEVVVYDINYERTKAFADSMQEELKSYNTKITAVKTSDEAVSDADLIITVTPSEKPVFDASIVKKGATVSCVGSYQPQMQEMDPVVLTKASKIYFDSVDAVLSEAGDILIPLADGTITKDDFTGDLGDLILGKIVGRENDDEIIVFKTVGIGTQDLVTAKHIYDKALSVGVGTEWN
ncbi:ornithine cyclodeaminase family protein [Clostridioides mangenotii]|uniref:ornithine cyclodeaminase family protein n=1 Tax=Metaclostridioides mangenotii TaxID=1540 RepID=UPI002149A2FE|nr:ornithine cyclodeaminase family protein [Clostridioides mangenotii]MCR1955946.1 ornithine cyclodeaminase family protein [Clostridioides mangenotii]